MNDRLSLWTALAVVIVAGLFTGVVVQAVWGAVLSATLVARAGEPPTPYPEHVLAVEAGIQLLTVVVTAALVKAGVFGEQHV
jgi:hypothetical protein